MSFQFVSQNGFVNARCFQPRLCAGLIFVGLLFVVRNICAPVAVLVCCCSFLVCVGMDILLQQLWCKELQGPLFIAVEDVENVPHSRIPRNTLEIR